MDSFPHGNWTEIDDETWQRLLADMNPAGINPNSFQDQDVLLEEPRHPHNNDGVYSEITPLAVGTDAANSIGYPPYVTLSTAEASTEAGSVPQAAPEGNDRSTVEVLRRLVDQLRQECEARARKLERLSAYVEELQPWTTYINNMVLSVKYRLDALVPEDNGGTIGENVYFASKGASHESCRKILALKLAEQQPEPRSMLAVRGKLDQIRKIPGLWDDISGWDQAAVDQWLVDLGVENLRALVEVR
ncbi:MAG: hypothetical protein Q9213_001144 [Squamulea squamosa]